MQELKCPKCGQMFQIDESGYDALVKQVRDREFSKEIAKREELYEKQELAAIEKAVADTEKSFIANMAIKETEIAKLKSVIETSEILKKSEINEIIFEKNQEIEELRNVLESFDKDKYLEITKLRT